VQLRQKAYAAGDLVKVKRCLGPQVYPLPEGLTEGATVKVVAKRCGYSIVEYEGRQFDVFMACIDSGWDFGVEGKWFAHKEDAVAEANRINGRL